MQKAYFFNGENYVRFDIPKDKVDSASASIKDNWKDFPATWKKIDAALNWGNGKIYFFSGSKYVRFDILTDKVDQSERTIWDHWHGFPSNWTKIDAAVNWGNGKAYFFNNDKYVRYDILIDEVDQNELSIKEHWHGYPWDSVDAVLNWGNGEVYIFKGEEYVRYSVSQDKVDKGKSSIKDNWNGFGATGWKRFDDAVIIDQTAEKMGRLLEQKIGPQTVGFAYTIYENMRQVKSGSGGARIKPGIPYTINTEMGIGSITKTLTAMATLKCLTDHKKKVNPDGDVLDAFISPWLPKTWEQSGSIKNITFRHLLSHKSGFRSDDDDYQSLKSMIKKGVFANDWEVYQYRNPNFSLMRVLIPMLTGIQLSGNDMLDELKVADVYKSYLQENVFKPSDVSGADCRINSDNYAMFYGPVAADLDAYPYDGGDDNTTMIAGAGGWKLSTLELGRVINRFFTTERIVPSGLREVMINERLGFESPQSACVKATKNGGWNGGDGQGYHNCYYIFTDGVQCVLMTNSTYPNNPMDPETAVQASHAASFGCS